MPPDTLPIPTSLPEEAPTQPMKVPGAEIVGNIINAADTAAAKSDRWWLAVLVGFGLFALYMMMTWMRENQQEDRKMYSEILTKNNEALTRVALTMDRLERKLEP